MTETSAGKEEIDSSELIRLFADNPEAADATLGIRWCFDRKLYLELQKQKALNPYLLITVSREFPYRQEVCGARRLIPLKEAMAFLAFYHPGLHRIWATIVWESNGDVKRLKRLFLAKNGIDYCQMLLGSSGKLYAGPFFSDCNAVVRTLGKGILDVDIDERFFAKEPPQWLWRWANFWFETKPRDECQFRKRCILAFTLQPPIILVGVIFKMLLGLFLAVFLKVFIGIRGINFSPVIHPCNSFFDDIWPPDQKSSVFLSNKKGDARPWFLFPLMPIVPAAVLGILALFNSWMRLPFWRLVAIDAAVIGAISFLFFVCWLVKLSLQKMWPGLNAWLDEECQKAEKEKSQRLAENITKVYERNLQPLVCRGQPLKPDIKALPPNRVSVRLRFDDLKRKVCRPFRR